MLPKFCSSCGSEVKENAKFCSECGATLGREETSKPERPDEEMVTFVLPSAKRPKSFGRHDNYCIAVTPRRMIFARVTGDMLKEASREAVEKAKEEGKGFIGRWGSQLSTLMNYCDRYVGKTPQDVLAENKENFYVDNSGIHKIRVKSKSRGEDDDYYEFTFETNSGKHKFEFDSLPNNYNELEKMYGNRVKKEGWFKLF